MYSLNNVQKFLIAIALGLFAIISIISFAVALPTFKIVSIRDLFYTSPVQIETNSSNYKYLYGDDINLSDNNINIQFNNNTLSTSQPIELKITNSTQVNLTSGFLYIDSNNSFTIINGKTKLPLSKGVKGIYNSNDKIFILLSGQDQLPNNVTIKINQYAIWQVDKFIVKDFDRNKLNTSDYSTLITTLKYFNQLPPELSKTTPPVLYDMEPAVGFKTSDPAVTIKGKVDPDVQVLLNNLAVKVDTDGNFSKVINLNIGNNQIVLNLTDKYGNKQNVSAIYTRDQENLNCNFTSLTEQLSCLINIYRKNNNVNNLAYSKPLEQVAYNHSIWMATDNNLSHIETNKTSYQDRCATLNVQCQFEILLKSSDNNPTNIFNLLENSSEFSIYLKDNHYTTLGIGFYNNYLTILLN